MDIVKWKSRINEAISKYKYVGIVLLAGIILMMIPGKEIKEVKTEDTEQVQTQEESVQMQLENILCKIKGAGKVKVMLTVSQEERTIYQTDSTCSQSDGRTDSRTQTILVKDSARNETGLIHQRFSPIYQGAIILAEGADLTTVKLAIVEAVSDVTGLGADRISVLKME